MKNLALWVAPIYQNDGIFDKLSFVNRDNCMAPLRAMKARLNEEGWQVHTQDKYRDAGTVPDVVLFFDIPSQPVASLLGDWRRISRPWVILQECEVIHPENWISENHEQFEKIFTWAKKLVDDKKYFYLNFSNHMQFSPGMTPFGSKKFCVMIAGNRKKAHALELYSEREKTVRWFEAYHPEDFDLYGVGWDRRVFNGPKIIRALNRLTVLTRLTAPRFTSYRGVVKEKLPVMQKYKFAICYENARDISGYITEKIFDSFFAGCVPVYWGASDIAQHVPKDCFIDRRDFKTHEDLYAYMKNMSEQQYMERQRAIREYLSSAQAYEFSDKYFAETISGVIARA